MIRAVAIEAVLIGVANHGWRAPAGAAASAGDGG
jgi:hypothetical protein